MIYACDACKYLFASDEENVTDCPDCGKHRVRPATQEEMKEYDERRKEAEEWYNGGGFLGYSGIQSPYGSNRQGFERRRL